MGLGFRRLSGAIQSDFPRPFGSEHLDRRELVHSRRAGRSSDHFLPIDVKLAADLKLIPSQC